MRWTPHALVEGCAIGAYAIGAETCVHLHPRRVHRAARARSKRRVKEAYAAGHPRQERDGHRQDGQRLRAPRRRRVHLRRRDRADELARGAPRQSAHQAAVPGGGGRVRQPTTINNVETLAAVPHILNNGADVVQAVDARRQPEEHRHQALLGVRQHRRRPGNYEVAMGFPFKDFLYDLCGGPLPGRKFKAIIPGGISVPIQTVEEAEASAHGLRGLRRAGHDARLRRRDRHRRRAEPREADRARRALLRARELRAVHAVPRRHGVDDEDPRAHRRRRRHARGSRHAAGDRRAT